MIRDGTGSALIEGVFWTSPDDRAVQGALSEAGIEAEPDGGLILTRELREQGRSVARVNGRVVPASLLQKLGDRLVNVSGQMEQGRLLGRERQLELVDGFAGLQDLRGRFAGKIATLRAVDRELKGLVDGGCERRRELLEYQVHEIDAAEVSPGEDERLERERLVLERARSLQEASLEAYAAMYENDTSASSLLHQAIKCIRGVVAIDSSLGQHLEVLGFAVAEIEETARTLRCYAEAIESRSDQLGEMERRLDHLRQLKNKYGPKLEDVIDFGNRAREELETLRSSDDRRGALEAERSVLEAEAGALAEELSAARQDAAKRLVRSVNQELADVGLPMADFDISLSRERSTGGLPTSQGSYACNQDGIDRVEFVGATNPGEQMRPLAEIASGGETCRFMLAVKSALRMADPVPTIVFDEIDAGIGGRSAEVVGKKLQALADGRQVICVTHLPQVACFGRSHMRLVKDVSSGRARTRVEALGETTRVSELAAMLGGEERSMVESAEELLRRAGRAHEEALVASV
jgi:DNA repair protein RecN (Recombination protein N)